MKHPNFFENHNSPWTFEDVLDFIHTHYEVKGPFAFRVGERQNSPDENQRAGTVLAYAKLMDYTFLQVKALFAQHDHCAIAMPETRQHRNILYINQIFHSLLQKGHPADIKINNFPEFFDIPDDVLVQKS